MFTEAQKQHIAEIVEQTAMGLFTKGEMVLKLETIAKQADPTAKFEDDADALGIHDMGAAAEAFAVLTSESSMAIRP